MSATVTELAPVSVTKDGESVTLRSFSLSLNGITVELCSVGASITKLLVPSYSDDSKQVDDVVLGWDSPSSLFESNNPPYFGVVVGRVANRIANATFTLEDDQGKPTAYKLDANVGPNALHGGLRGFNHCIWEAQLVDLPDDVKGVQFSLLSKDEDQGYPGTVQVTCTYSLVPTPTGSVGAALRLQMTAKLLSEKPTPISLAQHAYFNLASHDAPDGVLDHKLTMPNCLAYTPTDKTSIPTREVRPVKMDPAMDFTKGKIMREAFVEFGQQKAGLSETEAKGNMTLSRCAPQTAKAGKDSLNPGETYGFDHNYVIHKERQEGLNVVGIVEHAPSKRKMTVYTDAAGVQLYTGNYLDGVSLDASICKSSTAYKQWQSICLETQQYPDSILSQEEQEAHEEFAKGKCFILRPGEKDYSHHQEFHFEPMV